MKITEKADNMDLRGYDPVKLLMTEGTYWLWAAGYTIVSAKSSGGRSTNILYLSKNINTAL